MIKRTLVASESQIHIDIPNDYVGKQIEVLLYPSDEVLSEQKLPLGKGNPALVKGILTEEEAAKFDEYLKQARSEWDRDIS